MDVAVDMAGEPPMHHGLSVSPHSASAPSTQANGAPELGCDASHTHRCSHRPGEPHAARAAADMSTSVQTPARRPSAAQLRRGEGAYGCSHYRRRCKLVAPCCPEVFWCRHCHNQVMHDDEKVRVFLPAQVHAPPWSTPRASAETSPGIHTCFH